MGDNAALNEDSLLKHKKRNSTSLENGSSKRDERDPNKLTEEEERQVEELKKRDQEVRTHEMAHLAAAGSLAMGGPTYVYQTGPDGRNYAVGGHVKIDTSPGNTPDETISKARQIRAAATAPAEPSPQDMRVATKASQMEQEAQVDKREERLEEESSKSDSANFLRNFEPQSAISESSPSDDTEGIGGEKDPLHLFRKLAEGAYANSPSGTSEATNLSVIA